MHKSKYSGDINQFKIWPQIKKFFKKDTNIP